MSVLLGLLSAFAPLTAQVTEDPEAWPAGRETYLGRDIARTMHWSGAPWLLRETRENEENGELLRAWLDVAPGDSVCDFGCGNGYHTLPLAEAVGANGTIYAVDLQPEMLDLLESRAVERGVSNLVRVESTVDDPRLPKDSVDLVLMVDVYHELSHPVRVLGHVKRALRDGGRVVLVEFRAEDRGVRIKKRHKMSKAQIVREMASRGFALAHETDELPWQHAMAFEVATVDEGHESEFESIEFARAFVTAASGSDARILVPFLAPRVSTGEGIAQSAKALTMELAAPMREGEPPIPKGTALKLETSSSEHARVRLIAAPGEELADNRNVLELERDEERRWQVAAWLAIEQPDDSPAGYEELPALPPERLRPRAVDWLVERPMHAAGAFKSLDGRSVILDNGLLRRTILIGESLATVGLDDLSSGEALLRAAGPEARLVIDGEEVDVGGVTGQPNAAFVDPAWLETARANAGGFKLVRIETGAIEPRLEWKRVRHHAPDALWPPRGMSIRFDLEGSSPAFDGIDVAIHYTLYDGIAAYSKWMTIDNQTERSVTVDRCVSEILRAVEHTSRVESRGVPAQPPTLHVETDYAFGGMSFANANAHAVRWLEDPEYSSQVSYERTTPCLLEVGPTLGPAAHLAPGETFQSPRTFVVSPGADERERRGLARKRLMRTVAPWVTENPLMMHVRWAEPDVVRSAIDQCAAVGFEMVILTFGSGFNIEDRSAAYLESMAELAKYAGSKGIEIGGYSLLSSRRIEPAGDNCIHPETGEPGADIHGNCPSLTSAWGQRYFETLREFYSATGFSLLEHDGSYPGTPDAAARPPLQSGLENSRWAQWRVIDEFYRWCRSEGIYLNVPDHYFLAGSNKTGMGYREVNWSLPRADQVIHTRQNIYDGTWSKTPSMGWMFVPLTEYHGGGEAATIEPLREHLPHYERMLLSNLALGVQACYRGPRLFDGPETEAMVRKNVGWFLEHRRLLESDLVHGRRADGRDIDWMLHVDPFAPKGEPKGMLVAFNPTGRDLTRVLEVDLEYTGIRGAASIDGPGIDAVTVPPEHGRMRVEVAVPAGGMVWRTLSNAP